MIPISDLNLNFQQAEQFIEKNICICGGMLTIAYINREYVLKCGQNKGHDGIRRNKGNKELLEELVEKQQMALGKPIQTLAQVTGQDLEIILRNTYKGAPDLEIKKALMLCRKYDLDPLMKHLFLIKFKGKDGDTWAVVMGIKATRTMARRKLSYSYVSGPRRMTEDEQKNIFGETAKDKFWAITILRDKNGNEYPGYGFWPADKEVYGAEKGNTKANMAFIRSERNALDKLMPEGSPPVEVVDENYIDSTAMPISESLPENYQIDTDNEEAPDQSAEPLEVPKEAIVEKKTTTVITPGSEQAPVAKAKDKPEGSITPEQSARIKGLLAQKGIKLDHFMNKIRGAYNLKARESITSAQAEVEIKSLENLEDMKE